MSRGCNSCLLLCIVAKLENLFPQANLIEQVLAAAQWRVKKVE